MQKRSTSEILKKNTLLLDKPINKFKCVEINTFTQYGRNISFKQRYEASYINELTYFYKVLNKKEPMIITKDDSLTNLTIIKACEESCKTESVE